MSIRAFPAHDLHVTVSRTRVTLALAPGRALEGNNTVGNWKTVTICSDMAYFLFAYSYHLKKLVVLIVISLC